ncbi:MAG: glycosyltransferase family 39 protein [Lachnospiraceae bacterium]|nr:glycosyltransferase family 39 protein [Lachnospiraceae bacterium]
MKYIKKHAVFIFFLIEALAIGIFQTLGNTDKLWNYVFAENIASGLLPYRDFNLLQTPFSCLVNALFLTLFGHHMVVVEILGSVLFTLICMRLYRLCRELGATRVTSMIIPQLFLYLFCYNVFFEYSCLILFLLLCLLGADLMALRRQRTCWNRPGYQVALGVAAGLAILSKQT